MVSQHPAAEVMLRLPHHEVELLCSSCQALDGWQQKDPLFGSTLPVSFAFNLTINILSV